jgi:hypothetical protein
VTQLQFGSFANFRNEQCSRKAAVVMVHEDAPLAPFSMCRQHADMAERGFIRFDGETMDRPTRQETQRFGMTPPDYRKWSRMVKEEEAA